MDLSDLIDQPEARLPITRPDGSPVVGADGEPWAIVLAGPTHPRGFAAEEAMRLRLLRSYQQADEGTREVDYIDRVLEPLVIRTLSWGPICFDGQPFACTPANARTLYQQSDLVRRQVEAFLVRAVGFRKVPSGSSASTPGGTSSLPGPETTGSPSGSTSRASGNGAAAPDHPS